MKITVNMGNKFSDFDNQPLNTLLLNTGLTVIGILKNSHVVLKVNPLKLKLSKSFPCVVGFVTGQIHSLTDLRLDQAKTEHFQPDNTFHNLSLDINFMVVKCFFNDFVSKGNLLGPSISLKRGGCSKRCGWIHLLGIS